MLEISSQIYEKTAQQLCDEMGDLSYFSGTFEFVHEDTECRMVASLIIYHRQIEMPEGVQTLISDIVPVWWEFHTIIAGEEHVNDFDFALFKEYIIRP